MEADETYVDATFPVSTKKYPAEHKVLGVRWNTALDQLVFSLDALLEESVVVRPTKRVVISLIGRIYDPLGFLSPLTVCFKILMQELCKNKLGWDQQLSGEVLAKWTRLVDQLKGAPPITLPRCCLHGPSSEYRFVWVLRCLNCGVHRCGIPCRRIWKPHIHSLYCVKDSSSTIESCNYTPIGAAFCSVFGQIDVQRC